VTGSTRRVSTQYHAAGWYMRATSIAGWRTHSQIERVTKRCLDKLLALSNPPERAFDVTCMRQKVHATQEQRTTRLVLNLVLQSRQLCV
jgi:hypothetical protein